jgi:hypothetical protein
MDVLPATQENCYQHRSKTGTFPLCKRLTFKILNGNGRAGGIRTHDLLNPIQAHYQAVLRPDAKEAQDEAPTLNIQAGKHSDRQARSTHHPLSRIFCAQVSSVTNPLIHRPRSAPRTASVLDRPPAKAMTGFLGGRRN